MASNVTPWHDAASLAALIGQHVNAFDKHETAKACSELSDRLLVTNAVFPAGPALEILDDLRRKRYGRPVGKPRRGFPA